MANPNFLKALTAGAAISAGHIVKFSGNDVVSAAAASDLSIGIADRAGDVASGARVDVVLGDIAETIAGAAVATGQSVTSNANGRAIAAASGDVAVGWAFTSATADGDVMKVFIARHTAA